MAVHELRESANSRTNKLQQEMSTMQDTTTSIKAEWTVHMEKTESNHFEDTSAVESGRKVLEEVLHNWYRPLLQSVFFFFFFLFLLLTIFHPGIVWYAFFFLYSLLNWFLNLFSLNKAKVGAQQWRNAQESLLILEKSNVASVDSIVRYATSHEYSSSLLFQIGNIFFTFHLGEEPKPTKSFVDSFLPLYQLQLKMLTLRTIISSHPLNVSILFCNCIDICP
jgi:hypothetical protein